MFAPLRWKLRVDGSCGLWKEVLQLCGLLGDSGEEACFQALRSRDATLWNV